MDNILLYQQLAHWYHLLIPPQAAQNEGLAYNKLLCDAVAGRPRPWSLLELGCGGGLVAMFLKQSFVVTLTDISPTMLDVSRQLNPDIEHLPGDMRTLRLGRVFDVVYAQDALCYLSSAEEVRQTIATVAAHTHRQSVVLLCPDAMAESFSEYRTCTGAVGPDARRGRLDEWNHRLPGYRSGPDYVCDFVYELTQADGTVSTFQERHHLKAYSRELWIGLLREAGFHTELIEFDRRCYPRQGLIARRH